MTTTNLPISQEALNCFAAIFEMNQYDIVDEEGDDKHALVCIQRAMTQADAAGYRRGVEEAAGVAETFYKNPPVRYSPDETCARIAAALRALGMDEKG